MLERKGKYLLVVPTQAVAKQVIKYYGLPNETLARDAKSLDSLMKDTSIGHATFVYVAKDSDGFPRAHRGPMCPLDAVLVWGKPTDNTGSHEADRKKKTTIIVFVENAFTAKGERLRNLVDSNPFCTEAHIREGAFSPKYLSDRKRIDFYFEKKREEPSFDKPRDDNAEAMREDLTSAMSQSMSSMIKDHAREQLGDLHDEKTMLAVERTAPVPALKDNLFQSRDKNLQDTGETTMTLHPRPSSVLLEVFDATKGEDRDLLMQLCQVMPEWVFNPIKEDVACMSSSPGKGPCVFSRDEECLMFKGRYFASIKEYNDTAVEKVDRLICRLNCTRDVLLLNTLQTDRQRNNLYESVLVQGGEGMGELGKFIRFFLSIARNTSPHTPIARVGETGMPTVVLNPKLTSVLACHITQQPGEFSKRLSQATVIYCQETKSFIARQGKNISTCAMSYNDIDQFGHAASDAVASAVQWLGEEVSFCAKQAANIWGFMNR